MIARRGREGEKGEVKAVEAGPDTRTGPYLKTSDGKTPQIQCCATGHLIVQLGGNSDYKWTDKANEGS